MAHSSLATVSVPADPSNYTYGRPSRIRCVTIHHMAGINSAEGCGRIFQNPGRNGSSHYGIGVNGEIGVYVEEENVAWTNSNWASNCESVTIENSNSSVGGEWAVSDATLNSCIRLVADIAKRNGLGTLVPGNNLTWHSMFAATTCPGDYLRARMQYIADEANKINGGGPAPTPTPTPTPTGDFKVGDKVTPKEYVDYYGTRLLKTRDFYFISSIAGDRAVLSADSVTGPIYAAMNTNNLNKVGDGPAPTPTPTPSGSIGVGDKVTLKDYVDYYGTRLVKTRDYYFVWQLSGDRAVLTADYVGGTVYAAVNVNNLNKVGGDAPAPAPAPSSSINVGDRVTLTNWVDWNGTRLLQTRDFYFVSELNGKRAVLRADSMSGAVYAAVSTDNLRKV